MGIGRGALVLIAVLMAAPVFWLPGLSNGGDALAIFSQYLGMTALIAMALSQLIATRWPGIEMTFGPLDRAYKLHKWLGLWALLATFLHDTIDADIRGLGEHTLLSDIAETAGEISLYGLLWLLIITVATFIPYHLWKWTHRFIGVFFVLSAFHYLFIQKPFSNTEPLGLYMGGICLVGLIAYAYTAAPRHLRPSRRYKVSRLEKEGNALAVYLEPVGRPLSYKSGQFAFISFSELGLTEPHPFTLSAAPQADGNLRMTIGPLGDYTIRLISRLEVGAVAKIEGPFGDFSVARGQQLWIAAGIGITPFAAMAGSLREEDGPVTLIHSVRNRNDGAHINELQGAAAELPNFTFIVRETAIEGRLTPNDITGIVGDLQKTHILYCGPTALRESLWQALRTRGLSARRLHYELFEIRTGIGMNRLFKWLVDRAYRHKRDKLEETA